MKRHSQFSSSSSKKKKMMKLRPPPSAARPKPALSFNPPPRGPRNERHHFQERIFLHHCITTVHPKILFVRDDGQVETKTMGLPSSGADLVLVGESRDKVCFMNRSRKRLCIWDLKEEKMEKEIAFDSSVPAAHGFGHTRNGQLKIVRFIIPPSVPIDGVFTLEICTVEEGEDRLVWVRREVNSVLSFLPEQGFAKMVCDGEDRFLFWKGYYVKGIIKLDLEDESLGTVALPPDASITHDRMSIGHGFQGRLALSVYVPASEDDEEPFSMLKVWTLERTDGGNGNDTFWHMLLTLPMEASSLLEPFVPLSIFFGRGNDGGVNFLFHRGEENVFHIVVRGEKVLSGPIPIPSFTYQEGVGIGFVCRQFQATRLRPTTSSILEPSKPKIEKDKPMRWGSRLSFADDTQ